MAKMVEDDPELTSSHRYTKITAIYRTTIDENNMKTSIKTFHNSRYKEGNTIGQVGVAVEIRPKRQVKQPTNEATITTADILPKE